MADGKDLVAWTQMQRDTLSRLFRKHLRGEVRFDEASRQLYSTDASLYRIEPLGVVIPRDQQDLHQAVSIAMEQQVPIVPRGGGTSLSGQSVGAGLVIDVSKYVNQILQTNIQEEWVEVEPGVVLGELNRYLAPKGYQFGPDVATIDRANIGGMIGNNSAGARSIVYGRTLDHVLSLDVILTDGSRSTLSRLSPKSIDHFSSQPNRLGHIYRTVTQVIQTHEEEIRQRFPKLLRRVSGYNLDALLPPEPIDLTKLIVGSEGTLATVAKARLKIVPVPKQRGVAAVHFQTLSNALAALDRIFPTAPSAIELLDGMIISLARQNPAFRHRVDFIRGNPEAVLIVEYSANTVDEIDLRLTRLREELAGSDGLSDIVATQEPGLREHIWNVRKTALPLLQTLPGVRKPITFVEDTAVDPARLGEFVQRFREILAQHGTTGSFYGHASVGCLHIRPLIDVHSPEGIWQMTSIADQISDLVLEFGGALSGEHGDGLARSMFNEKMFGSRIYQAFRDIKQAFDPHGLMNPGKIVDGRNLTENLRPALTPAFHLSTAYHYDESLGPLDVAARCNGNALCRRTNISTMCPSYMATREEQHSPRGRANLLRAAIEGRFPQSPTRSWAKKELQESLDLCLMCKACKTECPSSVDVAKMKSEYLNQRRRDHHATPLSRIIADTPKLARLGSQFAPLSNWVLRAWPSRWLMEWFLGIDRRRKLPRYRRRSLTDWFSQHDPACTKARGKVVLLADCFTNYHEPRIGRDAVTLLEMAGYQVYLATICCGRTMISKGFLDEAAVMIRQNVQRLIPYAEDGIAILGLEPSCILTLGDEWLDLAPSDDAREIARHIHLAETWLAKRFQEHATDLPAPPDDRLQVLYHGHCHQSAAQAVAGSAQALATLASADVQVLDSGCCGMAGSFGYEKSHYDVSVTIAGQRLLPAVRSTDKTVVAPGFSCRSQLHDLAAATALHPMSLLHQRLVGEPTA